MKNLQKTLFTLLLLLVSVCTTTVHAGLWTTFYHVDGLGSPVAATDANGKVIWTEYYQPYGEPTAQETRAQGNPVVV